MVLVSLAQIQHSDVADRDEEINTNLVLSESPPKSPDKNGKLFQVNISHRFDLSKRCPGKLK